jgi:hypothetical protein
MLCVPRIHTPADANVFSALGGAQASCFLRHDSFARRNRPTSWCSPRGVACDCGHPSTRESYPVDFERRSRFPIRHRLAANKQPHHQLVSTPKHLWGHTKSTSSGSASYQTPGKEPPRSLSARAPLATGRPPPRESKSSALQRFCFFLGKLGSWMMAVTKIFPIRTIAETGRGGCWAGVAEWLAARGRST